jgi:hypothetical protein
VRALPALREAGHARFLAHLHALRRHRRCTSSPQKRRLFMRKLIWIMAAALIGSVGCKKNESEKAATEVRKAQEDLDKQKRDVREEGKDVIEAGKDVAKEAGDVGEAERRLAAARTRLDGLVKSGFASIDAKLASLDSQKDAVSQRLATELHARRDTLFARTNAASTVSATDWDAFEKDVGDRMDKLGKDLDKALSNDKDREDILKPNDERVPPPTPVSPARP